MGKFTKKQRQKLNSINERLYDLERRVVPRAKQINMSVKDVKEACDHFVSYCSIFTQKMNFLCDIDSS